MGFVSDQQLEDMSIEERNTYLDTWVESISDAVYEHFEDEYEAALYREHQEELRRERWTY